MIEIPPEVRRDLIEHALRQAPEEACGLLAGTLRPGSGGRLVERFYPIANEDHSPYRYRLDPREQQRAVDEIDQKGWEVVGVFHSHTHTAAYPSPTDVDQSLGARTFYPNAAFVLASLADHAAPDLRAYTISDQGVTEVVIS